MATIQERLTEAENALHDLQIGKSLRVFVDQNGERVEYTAANRRDLTAYIDRLKTQLSGAASGPMYFGG